MSKAGVPLKNAFLGQGENLMGKGESEVLFYQSGQMLSLNRSVNAK